MNNIDISKISNEYKIRKLTVNDVDIILDLCVNNPQYYSYCSRIASRESIIDDLNVTPPNTSVDQKYYIGYFKSNELIAVMDLIDGYPNKNVAFIGFFMLNIKYQGRGLGSKLINDLSVYLREIGFNRIKLGIDKNNPQSNHFWLKNGFIPMLETKWENDVIVVAEKSLNY